MEKWRTPARWVNVGLTSAGLLIFGAIWLQLFFNPEALVAKAQDFAVMKSEQALEDAFLRIEDKADSSPLAQRALEIAKDKMPDAGGRLEALMETMDSAEMAEARERLVVGILEAAGRLREQGREIFIDDSPLDESRVQTALAAVETIVSAKIENARDLVVDRFDSVVADIRSDALIFTGSTAMAFGLALLLSLSKGAAAMRYLLPVSLALTVATLFAAYWYLFGQNWAMAVLTSSYMGWGYLVLLGVLFAVMLDIAVNKARVLGGIANLFSTAVDVTVDSIAA